MLVANRAQALHKGRRGGVKTAFALYWFNHDGGDIFRRGIIFKDAVNAGDGVIFANAVQGARIERAIDVTRHQPHSGGVRVHFPGQRQGVVSATVVCTAKGDRPRSFRCRAGDLHRVFYRFGTGGDQQGLLGEVARHFLVHDFAQLQIRLIGQHLEAGVGQFFQLRFDCRDDLRVQVSGVQYRNAASKIQEFTAFHVPDPAVFRARGKDRMNLSYATRDGMSAALH